MSKTTKLKRAPRSDTGSRRSEYQTRNCNACGSPVVRRASDMREKVFCNQGCYSNYLRETKTGKGRPVAPDQPLYETPWGMLPGYKYAEGYIYVTVPEHPNANSARRVAYHRIVMEKILGRYLLPEENVHHKNGLKDDNSPENLELWSRSQPTGARVVDRLAWAREFCKLYENLTVV